jgi:hypothetical protein
MHPTEKAERWRESDFARPGDVDIPGFPRIAWHRMMLAQQDEKREHERLKDAVVKAAQDLTAVVGDISVPSAYGGEMGLLEGAVRRLKEFEAEHQ